MNAQSNIQVIHIKFILSSVIRADDDIEPIRKYTTVQLSQPVR